jgi:hypothetical protein
MTVVGVGGGRLVVVGGHEDTSPVVYFCSFSIGAGTIDDDGGG